MPAAHQFETHQPLLPALLQLCGGLTAQKNGLNGIGPAGQAAGLAALIAASAQPGQTMAAAPGAAIASPAAATAEVVVGPGVVVVAGEVAATIRLARSLLLGKRPTEALQLIDKAVAIAPADVELLHLRGRCLEAAGNAPAVSSASVGFYSCGSGGEDSLRRKPPIMCDFLGWDLYRRARSCCPTPTNPTPLHSHIFCHAGLCNLCVHPEHRAPPCALPLLCGQHVQGEGHAAGGQLCRMTVVQPGHFVRLQAAGLGELCWGQVL